MISKEEVSRCLFDVGRNSQRGCLSVLNNDLYTVKRHTQAQQKTIVAQTAVIKFVDCLFLLMTSWQSFGVLMCAYQIPLTSRCPHHPPGSHQIHAAIRTYPLNRFLNRHSSDFGSSSAWPPVEQCNLIVTMTMMISDIILWIRRWVLSTQTSWTKLWK